MNKIPAKIGEFDIVRELGRGGMGIVYEAVQTSLGRKVALKVLGPGLGLTPRAVDRFRREAMAAAKLHHTNIVPVYATSDVDGLHFYVMELIDGPSLDAVIRQLRFRAKQSANAIASDLAATDDYVPLSAVSTSVPSSYSGGSSVDQFDRAATVIADVADALHHAHQNGVTHRDIKPSNLLLSSDGRLNVSDFGLARMLEQPGMTVTGEFVGTPAYMSPEQITAGRIPVDHRTDIYSLGATLYELLTLRPPFATDGRDKLLAMVIQKEPPPLRSLAPKVPHDLETICLKCLEKDPDRRYSNAKDLADDLRRYVNRFAILAKRIGPLGKLRKWVVRNQALSVAGLAVLIAIGAVVFFAWRAEAERQQRLADERKRDEDSRIERRQVAMDRAILAAMSGRLSDADAALLEAERFGADMAERRFIGGILSHYRGEPETAKRLLLEACAERPDWLSPRAFLAIVCNYAEDWEGEARHGNIALNLTPISPDDYLFRGYMVGYNNPRKGLPDVEEAYARRRSVLAQFIRAEVLSSLANESGLLEYSLAARDALRSVRMLMGDSPLTITSALTLACLSCNNCRMAEPSREAEARAWLDEAADDFRAATEYKDNRAALAARTVYLTLRDGNADAADAENRQAGLIGVDSSGCYAYLSSLFRQRKTEEALEYLRQVRSTDSDSDVLIRVAFLVEHDLPAAQAECRRALVRRFKFRVRPNTAYGASLAGLPDEARMAAKAFCQQPGFDREWEEFYPFVRRVTRHAYEGLSMDLDAEIGPSRWRRWLGYDSLGFAALGQNRQEEARKWFRQADRCQATDSPSYLFMRALRRRLIENPDWPPWLSKKN